MHALTIEACKETPIYLEYCTIISMKNDILDAGYAAKYKITESNCDDLVKINHICRDIAGGTISRKILIKKHSLSPYIIKMAHTCKKRGPF